MASTKIQFSLSVTGQDRKSITAVVSGCIDVVVEYAGVPSCAYQIGGWTLDRESILHSPELEESEFPTVGKVLSALQEAELQTEGSLKVTIPDMEEQAAENFGNILRSKQQLLKSALQAENEIQFQKSENSILLSCFHATVEVDAILAYLHFTIKLGNLAKALRYASPVERPADNEKYAFRCFLLRLGFIGPEYKAERKILLAPLEGNAAFKKQCAGGGRMKQISKEQLEYLRSQYSQGTRVELISMNDPYSSLRSGDQGTVAFVDDIGTVYVNWDCGSGLGLVYGEDSYKQI